MEPSVLISILNHLGATCALQKDYESAEKHYKRALALVESHSGKASIAVVAPLIQLAGLYITAKRYDEAQPCYERVLEIRTRQYGSEHAEVLASLLHMAELHKIQRDFHESEHFYEKAVAMGEHLYESSDPKVAELLEKLSEVVLLCGQNERASELMARARTIRQNDSKVKMAIEI